MTIFIAAEQVPDDLNDVRDRRGWYWTRDAVNDEGGWFTYPAEDRYLPLDELIRDHGPLTAAVHEHRPAPGPVPGPLPGVCFACGGTGEVHGPGGNGNWTGYPCGCETETCGLCSDAWPCYGAPEADRLAAEQEAV